MILGYKTSGQVSQTYEVKPHTYPKYGKTTTDPTFYEPAATRIANMYKSSGLKLEGVYDYNSKEDLEKFSQGNFESNIKDAVPDPRFNNHLLREEISQITTNLGNVVEDTVNDKSKKSKEKADRINESLQINEQIQKQNNSTNVEE